jgi:hypothetical protein
MEIYELEQMTTDQMTEWLLADAWQHEPQTPMLQAKMLEAAHAGTLSDGLRECWVTANRRAGERLLREADQLQRYRRDRSNPS